MVFKEKFIVSGVTTPLLSLGSVLRGGWSIYTTSLTVRDDIWIPLFLKHNSLCAKGCIQIIQDVKSQTLDASSQAIRAIHLSEPLQTMRPGWNCINDGLYGIFTKSRCYVDSILAPSRSLMWLRTTYNILIPGVSDVLTLAHDRVDSYASLGFFGSV